MAFLYNIGVGAYHLGVRLAAPFNEKARLLKKGRKEVWEKIRSLQRGKERLVWFHAASLGEFEQGRPVMEKLKQLEPDTKILLTFFLLRVMKSGRIIQGQTISSICRPIPKAMPSG